MVAPRTAFAGITLFHEKEESAARSAEQPALCSEGALPPSDDPLAKPTLAMRELRGSASPNAGVGYLHHNMRKGEPARSAEQPALCSEGALPPSDDPLAKPALAMRELRGSASPNAGVGYLHHNMRKGERCAKRRTARVKTQVMR